MNTNYHAGYIIRGMAVKEHTDAGTCQGGFRPRSGPLDKAPAGMPTYDIPQ